MLLGLLGFSVLVMMFLVVYELETNSNYLKRVDTHLWALRKQNETSQKLRLTLEKEGNHERARVNQI